MVERQQGVRTEAVNFSPEAYDTLHDVAQQSGRTMTETLSDSIGHLLFLTELQQSGGTLLVEREEQILHSTSQTVVREVDF